MEDWGLISYMGKLSFVSATARQAVRLAHSAFSADTGFSL
jgi:hypothetical protein